MKTLTKLVENEIRPLSSGEVLHLAVEKMSVEDRLSSYAVIQWMQDKLAKRREILNGRIKEDVKQVGTTTEKGHMRFEHNHTVATVEKRVGKMPDENGLNLLLAKAGISEDEVYDEVKVSQLNPSKVEKLIELGKLKKDEVEALKKTTYALTVDPSEAISKLLSEVSEAFEEEKAAVTGEEKSKKELPAADKPKKGKGKASTSP